MESCSCSTGCARSGSAVFRTGRPSQLKESEAGAVCDQTFAQGRDARKTQFERQLTGRKSGQIAWAAGSDAEISGMAAST